MLVSPINHHETLKLALSRPWKPPNSSRYLFFSQENKPNLVFLVETKLRNICFETIKRRLGFDSCFVVDPMVRKGGLAMQWNNEYIVEIVNYSQHHIHAQINDLESRVKWFLIDFYGHPKTSRIGEKWELLSPIRPSFDKAWCVIGYFNGILSKLEKQGGRPRLEKQMEFRQMMECNNMHDLGWKGDRFSKQ